MSLPGVLTVLSVLAVVLGSHVPAHEVHETSPRPGPGMLAPTIPELRALPASAPGPLLATPPAEPDFVALPRFLALRPQLPRALPSPVALTEWGKRQIDGG